MMATGELTQGWRVRDVDPARDGHLWDSPEPGSYWFDGAYWWACTPNGLLGNLRFHDVLEYADGTITVAPSILVDAPGFGRWHGYLEHGVWREV